MFRRSVVASLAGACALAIAAPASAAPTWAPAASATIHPGVQTLTAGGQCTANFIFWNATDIYIGQSAHCASTSGATTTNGCEAGSRPLGTPVEVDGASRPGTLAYSSWVTMQANGETDDDTCQFNDFALVRLDPADHAKVNPSVPHWGGPTREGGTTATGTRVYSYGNSSLRAGITLLSPKTGISLGQNGGGWNHPVYTVTPGIPGDSGSAFLGATGEALGTLSTLAIAPFPASNGVADLAHTAAYMRAHEPAFADAQLGIGTERFDGSKLPLGL